MSQIVNSTFSAQMPQLETTKPGVQPMQFAQPAAPTENPFKLFENPEFGRVRVVIRDGEPWFVASDVAKALAFSNPSDAVNRHCKKAMKTPFNVIHEGTPYNPVQVNIIPESDLYRLVMRANTPKAEAFQTWVCEEVLPSIRKTGSYSITPALPDFTNPAEAARAWANEYEAKVQALAEVERQKAVINDQAQTIEAQEIALGDNTNWKAVLGIPWLETYFIDKSTRVTSRIGKVLTAMSRALGVEKRLAEDDRWGTVGVYHIDVIEEFRRRLDNDPYILSDIRRHS